MSKNKTQVQGKSQSSNPGKNSATVEPKPVLVGSTPRRALMNYPGSGTIKQHRPGTKRALVVELLTRPEGATFVDVQKAIAEKFPTGPWNDRTCKEGITLISKSLGYRLSEDASTGIIRATQE